MPRHCWLTDKMHKQTAVLVNKCSQSCNQPPPPYSIAPVTVAVTADAACPRTACNTSWTATAVAANPQLHSATHQTLTTAACSASIKQLPLLHHISHAWCKGPTNSSWCA
jgi:hypothetical protein